MYKFSFTCNFLVTYASGIKTILIKSALQWRPCLCKHRLIQDVLWHDVSTILRKWLAEADRNSWRSLGDTFFWQWTAIS